MLPSWETRTGAGSGRARAAGMEGADACGVYKTSSCHSACSKESFKGWHLAFYPCRGNLMKLE